MKSEPKIRVLIVDDSALMRELLSALLAEDRAIEVVGTAADPFLAREKIKRLKPQVITLDVEMPGMDGLTFLANLMRLHPLPVIMVSSFTEAGTQATLRALDLGAVDFVTKPAAGAHDALPMLAEELRAKVRAAATAHVRTATPRVLTPIPAGLSFSAIRNRVITMGASTGGTQAIAEILESLPAQMPGIAVVQHMPRGFTASFSESLNSRCALQVREARDGDRLEPGTVLIAPGGNHMVLIRTPTDFAVRVYEGAPVNRHRPSVDVLFESAAQCAGPSALGALLTGMGSDGARGLLALHAAGAHTIAQDEASCVVYGMPEQAIRLGAAREIVPLNYIASRLLRWIGDEPLSSRSRQGTV